VIVRLSGEGQYKLSDDQLAALNELDNRAVGAVEAGDEAEFSGLLSRMATLVRTHGEPLAGDDLHSSDVIVPPLDTTLAEAQADFSGDGLIPG
jgi:hypothetical protein